MAYGRTHLELVNDVLVALRESPVTSVNASSYTALISTFINACKRDAENAWKWDALRVTADVTTAPLTITYQFTGTDERAQILDAWNLTKKAELEDTTWGEMNALYFGGTPQQGSVQYYVSNGVNVLSGHLQVDLYPVPNAAEALKFTLYVPQADLAANGDVMAVPFRPVVEGAVARARFERGEDGGISADMQASFMQSALADHIALDAGRHNEDIVWEAV